jgi:hypothetical protein
VQGRPSRTRANRLRETLKGKARATAGFSQSSPIVFRVAARRVAEQEESVRETVRRSWGRGKAGAGWKCGIALARAEEAAEVVAGLVCGLRVADNRSQRVAMVKPRMQRDGKAPAKRARPRSSNIEEFIGRLKGRRKKVATIEEINEATARGWAGGK